MTGSYGSGKTSVIKTFKEKENRLLKKKKRKKIIDVSLASFLVNDKQEKQSKPSDSEVLKERLEYLTIEKSILQQLFYKVKGNTIAFSRFRKIKKFSFWKAFILNLIFCITIFLGIFIIKPYSIYRLLRIYFSFNFISSKWILIISLITFILLALFLLTQFTIFVVKKIRVSKFNLKNIEIEIDEKESSIFNKYLDEILYFFEVTDFDVIVIEDLDRLNKPEIFVKLRELNNLINNSDLVNQTVTFIYCIGDSVFKKV